MGPNTWTERLAQAVEQRPREYIPTPHYPSLRHTYSPLFLPCADYVLTMC